MLMMPYSFFCSLFLVGVSRSVLSNSDVERNSGGKILVHCALGISRSPIVVIAFVMKRLGMKFEEAYEFVKKKRSIIRPNDGFCQQVRQMEESLMNNTENEK